MDRGPPPGRAPGDLAAGQVAINTVFHDAPRPSPIVLPVIRR